MQKTTVTSEVWDDNVIMSGDIVVTIVDDGETITAIANETGLMYGVNYYKKEGDTYFIYQNGSFVETTQNNYQLYENSIRGILSEFEGEYDMFTYNSNTQAYECATYGTYYTDVAVKFVDGKFVYMSYSYTSGSRVCTRTVSVSYETREIEYPSAS